MFVTVKDKHSCKEGNIQY